MDKNIVWTTHKFPSLIREVRYTVTDKRTGNIVEEKSFDDGLYEFYKLFSLKEEIRKVIIIQKYFQKYKKIKRMIKWVNSYEFNKWYYSPENPGGKRAIQKLKNKMKLI